VVRENQSYNASRLAGKVAIVTGGASGIGQATWRKFVLEGARVVVTDISETDRGEEASLCSEAVFQRHDVRRLEDWREIVALTLSRFGRIDVLVNSAGILREGTVEDTTLADWRDVLAVNLDGTFYGCRSVIPAMQEAGGGSIINLSSVSGIKADATLVAYDASKGAVRALTKEVAVYCARRGYSIRCNSVHPGIVDTGMVGKFFETAKLSTREEWSASQPISRPVKPQEVAEMITFLASAEASFVTGAEFVIDGGMTA
jgi:3(or 17)beta-hydroxysteroid dehydrogenase